MNLSKNSSASFDLSGLVRDPHGWGNEATNWFEYSMPACNTTREMDKWSAMLLARKWWNTRGWFGFRYPTMNASFDDHTVNLTIRGLFEASVYMSRSIEGWQPRMQGNSILGDVEIQVRGVLDPYHSDILDVNSSTPTWLRTVGFGNNSLNIDNDAKNAATRPGVAMGSASIVLLSVLFGMALSA